MDVRLRPFGSAGPLAVSVSALENYLLQNGRDWERYAWIKARVVNDWADAEYLYRDVLRPFVYRRYLDYGVFSSLREMKALIEAEVAKKEFRGNLKLGPGGIREIEFIVQALQLVRGGTVAPLREREILKALPALVQAGCLPERDAAELTTAYRFLRLAENRIQALYDRQTHDLPADPADQQRLALAMGFPDWAAFLAALQRAAGRGGPPLPRHRLSRHERRRRRGRRRYRRGVEAAVARGGAGPRLARGRGAGSAAAAPGRRAASSRRPTCSSACAACGRAGCSSGSTSPAASGSMRWCPPCSARPAGRPRPPGPSTAWCWCWRPSAAGPPTSPC